jgi:mannose-6-phosphate isomerase-like protein (cupin superfamily)
MDHLLIPAGSSEGLHKHASVGEVYYVLAGEGDITVGSETAPLRKGDGVPILPGEAHSIASSGTQDLELMIIGVATEKGKLDTIELKP